MKRRQQAALDINQDPVVNYDIADSEPDDSNLGEEKGANDDDCFAQSYNSVWEWYSTNSKFKSLNHKFFKNKERILVKIHENIKTFIWLVKFYLSKG